MNTFQLTCFLAVADTLSFARAADSLHITQPAVTHQIHTLENELNVQLFQRTTRNVEITFAGKTFFHDAKKILAISNHAKKRFEDPSTPDIRPFSIGSHSYVHLFHMQDILKQMALIHPNLHPRFQVIPHLHLYRLLEEGDLDVVIGLKEATKTTCIYKELGKTSLICLCSASHPFARRSSVTFEDLKTEKLIAADPIKFPGKAPDAELISQHLPADLFFYESIEEALVLAAAEYGVAVIPGLFVPASSNLVPIHLEGAKQLSYGLYYKTLKGNDCLKTFTELAEGL